MLLIKKYMAEEILPYKCLIEVVDYCKAHSFEIKMLEDNENGKEFQITLSKDAYLTLSVSVIQNEHIRPVPLVIVGLESAAAHSGVTKKIAKGVRTAGKIVGGGIGAVVSIATIGIGWIAGTGITYGAYKIGQVPGVLIDKIDDFFTDNALKKFESDVKAITAIFDGRMVSVPAFENHEKCNEYILSHNGVYIYNLKHEKKKLDISYNFSVSDKKTTKFFRTITPRDSELIVELKNKVVEKATITHDKEVEMEIFLETYSACVGATYAESAKDNSDIKETKDILERELKKRLIGVCPSN